MLNTFFGFKGRIGRGTWWLAELVAVPVVYLLAMTALISAGMLAPEGTPPEMSVLFFVLIVAVVGAALWINVAATVKRFHDRGKSGTWFLITFIPFVGPIWQIVECGFCKGDDGINEYGPPGGLGSGNDSPHVSGGTYAATGGGNLAKLDDDYFRKYAAQSARMAEPIVQSTYARPATTVSAPGGFGGKPTFGRR